MALSAAEQASLEQSQRESDQQYQMYMDTYAPLEASYANEAANWDSPQAIAEARGQAMGDIAEQGQAGLNTAAETLRTYGINPGSGRYAGLYTGAQPMLGAAEAAAGTTAAQNLRLQKMGLESGAINTGRGLVNATEGLTNAGTGSANSGDGSASGAAGTANQNLSTGLLRFQMCSEYVQRWHQRYELLCWRGEWVQRQQCEVLRSEWVRVWLLAWYGWRLANEGNARWVPRQGWRGWSLC